MTTITLKKSIDMLPRTVGVYLFYEANVRRPTSYELIYIGKAINIKDRVKNHFAQPSYRDNLFIAKVSWVDFIETKSEIEALVLEAQLIKKHLPKFNVVWKDDKNYFYVCITKDERPVVFITHQPHSAKASRGKATFIGPFVEGVALKKTLKYLRRVFPFYTSARHPKTLCTWCHLGLCPGPNPNLAEYKFNLKKLAQVLQGKRKTVLFSLKKEMAQFSYSREYEQAAKIRNQLLALAKVMEHTHVIENSQFSISNFQFANEKLQKLLGMKKLIHKIECYDISNIQGKNAVGSMVVFVNGAPDKSQYKKFRIRMKNEPNDIAMLKEVLTRRLAHKEWPYPQVMLIDGGKAQLNIAINSKSKTLNSKQIQNIKIISIAKGRQELFIESRKKPIPLKKLPQEVYNLVKHLDDEAHRFAITYHKKVRKRAMGLT